MLPVNLWLLTRVLFYAHAAAGPSDTRLSLRPLFFEGQIEAKPRTHRAARTRTYILSGFLTFESRKPSTSSLRGANRPRECAPDEAVMNIAALLLAVMEVH